MHKIKNALGELVIIVAGVLIALAIDQWNSDTEYVDLLADCGYSNARCERVVKPTDMADLNQLLAVGWKMTG